MAGDGRRAVVLLPGAVPAAQGRPHRHHAPAAGRRAARRARGVAIPRKVVDAAGAGQAGVHVQVRGSVCPAPLSSSLPLPPALPSPHTEARSASGRLWLLLFSLLPSPLSSPFLATHS
eukprot:234156-Chlamydomonas_euryale.AAC.1